MATISSYFPIIFNTVFFITALLLITGSKYSLRKTLLIVIPSVLILLTGNILLFATNPPDTLLYWLLLTICLPETVLAYFISNKKTLSFFGCVVNVFIGLYLIYIIDPMLVRFFDDNLFWIIFCYVISFPIITLYLYFFYGKLHDLVEKILPKFLGLLTLYGISMILEIIVYQFLLSITNDPPLRLEVFGIGILSVYFISIVGVYIFLYGYNKTISESIDQEVLNRQIQMIQDNAFIRQEKEKDLRILRHDLKHLIITLNSLLQAGDVEKALELLSTYQELVENTTTLTFCKDQFINSILEYYYNKCKINNIKFEVKVNNFEENLKVPLNELVLVISNALDNAVTASLKLKENRYISFKFINNNSRLVLQITNNYAGKINYDENRLPTNKNDRHGLGTKSIEKFVEKHNLTLDYSITKKTFQITILF